MMEKISSTREAFVRSLMELAAQDENIMLVCADSVKAVRATVFQERYPERLYDVGIAEQNACGFAAGMASCGFIPFVATYSGFITMRACEQVRTFIAYPGLNVKLVGLNGGMFGGEREGVTHQFFEDVGILRSIPGITIVTPADANQVYHATKAITAHYGPCFLRLGSGREHEVYSTDTPFILGKINTLYDYGKDVAVFSSGFVLNRAIMAVEALRKEGIYATLIDVPTIKPIDSEVIIALLKSTGCAVTVEDHNIIGGLGSAVAETAADAWPVPIKRVGLKDIFPRSGAAEQLLDAYGIGVKDIVSAVKDVLLLKKT